MLRKKVVALVFLFEAMCGSSSQILASGFDDEVVDALEKGDLEKRSCTAHAVVNLKEKCAAGNAAPPLRFTRCEKSLATSIGIGVSLLCLYVTYYSNELLTQYPFHDEL